MGPLFILGNPRSGTSLLRLILTSHSKVLIPPECGFIIWLQNKYFDWQSSDNNLRSRREAFLKDLSESRKFEIWSLDVKLLEEIILANQPDNYGELCALVYSAYGRSREVKYDIWGDKNNFHIHYLNELHSIYPKSRMLHIVRDGRDVACSYQEVMESKFNNPYAPKLSTGISEIAREWSNNVQKVNQFLTSLPEMDGMTIRYEDLVQKPAETVHSICSWLGIHFEETMLHFYHKNALEKMEPDQTMDWKKRTKQPISGETVGRYLNLLSSKDQELFLQFASNELGLFKYL